MTRRGFLAAAAAALVLDPERALWVPGAKVISVPAPAPAVLANGDSVYIYRVSHYDPIKDDWVSRTWLFHERDPRYAQLRADLDRGLGRFLVRDGGADQAEVSGRYRVDMDRCFALLPAKFPGGGCGVDFRGSLGPVEPGNARLQQQGDG